mmetsp:Transcript_16162/g.17426  ORF Transcript_16162/g.17426 Transcript_16162/m.17426 type:complete len:83 (+) Transcript_16162:522-770(+)
MGESCIRLIGCLFVVVVCSVIETNDLVKSILIQNHPTVNNCKPKPKHIIKTRFLKRTGSMRELAYCPIMTPTNTPGKEVIQK